MEATVSSIMVQFLNQLYNINVTFKRQIRGSIVVSISACHAEDPGSIPGRRGPRALRWPGSPHQPGSGCGTWSRWVFPAECTGAVACSMALLRLGDRWALPGDDLRRMQSR